MSSTHFGFKTVDEKEKAKHVRGVFDSVASKYDVMNDLMSAGLHRVWKAYTVQVANLQEGDQVLDIAGGTGDLSLAFSKKVLRLAHPYEAKVLINAAVDLVQAAEADGVHLNSVALAEMKNKPDNMLVAASCHHAQDLAKAKALQLDFVLLSPVLPTASHPDALTLGWESFAALKQDYPLPVYALGGLKPEHLNQAWLAGAHGIAMQRAVWEG